MRRLRPLLGTYVAIDADGSDEGTRARAIEAAFAAVALVHRLMSVHRSGSDISRVNRMAWRQPVDVHPWTARTLRWALLLHEATGGLFDCAVGHELARWGVLTGCGFDDAEPGTLADLEVTRDGAVRLARRIGIDLGGIAKGFAVDRAITTLRRLGVHSAVVNAGGDIRVMGREPQPIHLRDPADPRLIHLAGFLHNGAIATSSATATTRTVAGRQVSTLVSARDRRPVVDADSCSVLAPTCVAADALTKALVQTKRTDAPWLARFGATALITAPRAGAT